MYMVYASAMDGDLFAYCSDADKALAVSRDFESRGVTFVEVSDLSGNAVSPDEFERLKYVVRKAK
jgi:hypothetical protein